MTEIDDLRRFREHMPAPAPDAAERVIARLRAGTERANRPVRHGRQRRPLHRRLRLAGPVVAVATAAFLAVALWPGEESGPSRDVLDRAAAAITPTSGSILHVSSHSKTVSTVVDASTGRRVRGPVVERDRGESWTVPRPTRTARYRVSDDRGLVYDDLFVVDANDPNRTKVTSWNIDRRAIESHYQATTSLEDPIEEIRAELQDGLLRPAGRTPDGLLRLRQVTVSEDPGRYEVGEDPGHYEVHVDPDTYEPRREISEDTNLLFTDGREVLPIGPGERAHEVTTTVINVERLPDNRTTRKLLRVAPPR